MYKKLLLVMNPCAGVKKSNRYLTDILAVFAESDFECTVQLTTNNVRASEIVERFGEGKDLVVCIGGDGTFNETISGLLSAKLHPLVGYIPSGSTNDFANSLSLSQNPVDAAKDIIKGKQTNFDIGLFNGRAFTYVASFGAFTKASYSAPRDLKNMLGHLAYILEGMKELGDIKTEHIKIVSNTATSEGDYVFGAICNSTTVGGGVIKFPKSIVDMNDGLFEIMLVKMPTNPAELMQLIIDLNSFNYKGSMFEFFKAKDLRITASPDMNWTLDGEYEKGSEIIEVHNLHSAVTLLINTPSSLSVQNQPKE